MKLAESQENEYSDPNASNNRRKGSTKETAKTFYNPVISVRPILNDSAS